MSMEGWNFINRGRAVRDAMTKWQAQWHFILESEYRMATDIRVSILGLGGIIIFHDL